MRIIGQILMLALMLAQTGNDASGQFVGDLNPVPENQGTVASSADPSGPGFYRGPVIPASMTIPARVLNKRPVKGDANQIRISLQFLLVDSETRDGIYRSLDPAQIKTAGNPAPAKQAAASLDGLTLAATCSELVRTNSHMTTVVLDEAATATLLQSVSQSTKSKVSAAPSVVLFDGQYAEVNNAVQRPFVTDFKRVMKGAEAKAEPNVQVFSEGTTVRLKALTIPAADSVVAQSNHPIHQFHLASELVLKTIVDVKSEPIYGIKDEPLTVQRPLQQIKTVVAAADLNTGQTLLVDPYVTKREETRVETGVPILSKLPYISGSFKNTAIGNQDYQVMVLLKPSIEPQPIAAAQSINSALTQ